MTVAEWLFAGSSLQSLSEDESGSPANGEEWHDPKGPLTALKVRTLWGCLRSSFFLSAFYHNTLQKQCWQHSIITCFRNSAGNKEPKPTTLYEIGFCWLRSMSQCHEGLKIAGNGPADHTRSSYGIFRHRSFYNRVSTYRCL